MMMDDVFFDEPAKCQECQKIYESGLMVWFNGQHLCPKCYGRKNNDKQGICGIANCKNRPSQT